MQTKRMDDDRWILVLDTGDEAVECLTRFARDQGLTAGRLTAIGAFADAVLGFFDFEKKDYHEIRISEQVEVASLIGDYAMDGDEPKLHAHAVLARHDGLALGGHLLSGHVHPTLEVMVSIPERPLRRVSDAATGLALIDLDAME